MAVSFGNIFQKITLKDKADKDVEKLTEDITYPSGKSEPWKMAGSAGYLGAMSTRVSLGTMSMPIVSSGVGGYIPPTPEPPKEKEEVTELNWKKPKSFNFEDTNGKTKKYFDAKGLRKDLDKALKAIRTSKDKNKAKALLKELNALETKLRPSKPKKEVRKVGDNAYYEGMSLTPDNGSSLTMANLKKTWEYMNMDELLNPVSRKDNKLVVDTISGKVPSKKGVIKFKCPNCSWKETVVDMVEDSPISMSFNLNIKCPNCQNSFVDKIDYKTINEII